VLNTATDAKPKAPPTKPLTCYPADAVKFAPAEEAKKSARIAGQESVPTGLSATLTGTGTGRLATPAKAAKMDKRKGPRNLAPDRRNRFGVLIRHQGEPTKAFKARLAADKSAIPSCDEGKPI
jgi:hypothetical protein